MTPREKPKGRADLKELAKTLRRRLDTLYTLGSVADPWMVDQDFRSNRAHWIADLFQRLELPPKVHDRQIHYKLVSQRTPVLQVDGTPYLNNPECYERLCHAIKDARYLDLIPARMIVDRRNPEPIINFDSDEDVSAEIEINHGQVLVYGYGRDYLAPFYTLPSAELVDEPSFGERYHLEIWIEKSTQNEVLLPLGREYGINVCTFIGEVSLTSCEDLVDRVIASGRPARILHITDFDPAGRDMPISAAVKIDFMAEMSGHDLDIRLDHVALTEEQCIQYRLPRTPIKDTETRAAGFEERYGDGGTELDALEALHPGVLRQILVEHIERYRDDDLENRVEGAIEQYRHDLALAAGIVRHRHRDELDALDHQRALIQQRFGEMQAAGEAARVAIAEPAQSAFDVIVDPARATYEAIVAAARLDLDAIETEAQGTLAAFVAQADDARDEIIEDGRDEIEAMEQPLVDDAETLIAQINVEFDEDVPEPDQFDWPEPEADEWDNPLYDSTRPYVEQVDVYRKHRGDEADVGLAADRMVTKTCALPGCGESFSTANPKRKVFCSQRCSNKSSRKAQRDGPQQTDLTDFRSGISSQTGAELDVHSQRWIVVIKRHRPTGSGKAKRRSAIGSAKAIGDHRRRCAVRPSKEFKRVTRGSFREGDRQTGRARAFHISSSRFS
jgi:hypothetical protein